ncbi:RNA recognition motif domain-containing protein [Ditylenchus destructor]|uniref:RNA recognition motif domain-containing protein n=1 Tax=Ditylenchus destructor TaxID=166010 RepID=A0AAD4MXA8_9BILA|nr:RNA recognition motif domain-containing protein [Ditylenchus destructor]
MHFKLHSQNLALNRCQCLRLSVLHCLSASFHLESSGVGIRYQSQAYQRALCLSCLFQRRLCTLLPQVFETVIKRNLATTPTLPAKKYKLVIGGLPKDTNKDLLVEYYSKIGEVKRIDLKPSLDEPNKLETQAAHIFFNSQTRLKMAMKAPLPECAKFNQDKRLPEDYTNKFVIFVGGLKSDTTEEMLYAFYAQFGTPLRVVLKKCEKGMSMKFAHVTYKSKNEVESALSSAPHVIDGKEVTVRERRPLDRTVFVGLLAENTSEESLTLYFSQFGTVKYCIFKRSEWTGMPLRAAYVTFAEPEQMNAVLSSAPHKIDGKTVTVANTEGGSHLHRAAENTLFLKWMSPHTTVDSLERFYSRFGQLLDCAVSKALKSLPHEIDSVKVVVEPFKIGQSESSSEKVKVQEKLPKTTPRVPKIQLKFPAPIPDVSQERTQLGCLLSGRRGDL